MNKIYSPQQKLALHIALIIGLGFFIVYGLREYIPALIGSVILFVLFRRFFHYLHRRRRWGKGLSITVVFVSSLFVIVLPLLLVGVMIARKAIAYSTKTDALVDAFNQLLSNPMVIRVQEMAGIDLQNKELLQQVATRVGTFATELFTPLLSGTLSLFVSISILYFILFYLFYDEDRVVAQLHKFLPFDDATIDEMYQELANNVTASVLGQGLIALVQASLTGLGFLIFGINDAFFWGVVAFFTAFIPVLGTPLVWVPAGVIELAQGDQFSGFGILIWGGVLVLNIDNFLRFAIAKHIGDIHPLITILGVIFGLQFFGILGLVMGPLLISYFLVLVKAYQREYGSSAALPSSPPPPPAEGQEL